MDQRERNLWHNTVNTPDALSFKSPPSPLFYCTCMNPCDCACISEPFLTQPPTLVQYSPIFADCVHINHFFKPTKAAALRNAHLFSFLSALKLESGAHPGSGL